MAYRFFAYIAFGMLLTACTSIERLAIPSATPLAPELAAHGQAQEISHLRWDTFLQRYTVRGNDNVVRVSYGAVTPSDKAQLNAYLAQLSATDVTKQPRAAQLAYWINLYNALTVKTILDHYPVDSIRQIRKHIFDPGPWDEKRITIAGRPLSLHNIEHGIVRALWPHDPRTHYALNCAAVGCPNLAQRAYTAANLEQLLHANTIAYVNDPRGVSVDKGDVTASKIYAWYEEDYGGSEASVLQHIRRYAAPALKAQLHGKYAIDHYYYDWKLNDTAQR